MRAFLGGCLIAALFGLGVLPAEAQIYPNINDKTVIGRLGSGSGNGQPEAIPLNLLGLNLFGAVTPGNVIGIPITDALPGTIRGVPYRTTVLSPTLYVNAASGVDANNNCLSSGSPCQTPQHAINYFQQNFDVASTTPNIILAAGTGSSYGPITLFGNGVGATCIIVTGAPSQNISAATNASPIVVTYTGPDPTNGDSVVMSAVGGNTAANGSWKVAGVNTVSKTFQLANSVGNGAYTSGGTFYDTTSVTIAGGSTYAIDVEKGGCLEVSGGVKLTSTGVQDAQAIRYGSLTFSNAVEFGAPVSGAAGAYATRFGYIEVDGGIAISGNMGEVFQSDHTGNIRWNGTILGFTANVTFSGNNAIFYSDGGDITETGGGSIATNSYTITVNYGSYTVNGGFVQIEGYSPPQTTFFGSISFGVVATQWAQNTNPGNVTGVLQQPTGMYSYGGTTDDWCFNTSTGTQHLCIDVNGNLLFTNKAAPSSPSSGLGYAWFDSTDFRFHDKNQSGTIGTTVVANAGTAHEWFSSLSAAGVLSPTQPSFGDISGILQASQCPAPSASTVGCVESYAAVTSQWIKAISPAGVVSSTQPAFSDISGTVPNSQLATMPANTVKCNNTGGAATPIDCTVSQLVTMIALPPAQIILSVSGVNFNSANTDTAIAVPSFPGLTRYKVLNVVISGASTSLTTATFGVFTATGGGGTAIVNAGTAITVSTGSDGTNNNTQTTSANNNATISFTFSTYSTLYFRLGTAEGVTATGNVALVIVPMP